MESGRMLPGAMLLAVAALAATAGVPGDPVEVDALVSDAGRFIEFRTYDGVEIPLYAYLGVTVVGDMPLDRFRRALELANLEMSDRENAYEVRNLLVAPFGEEAPAEWRAAEAIVYSDDTRRTNKCYTGYCYVYTSRDLDGPL